MGRTNHIQVASGGFLDPINPDPDDILIEDIAHALSNICRFNGHSNRYYSVAEHSVHVSRVCDPADARWGILHDSPEYGLSDMSSPLKHGTELGAIYQPLEAHLMSVIAAKFGLAPDQPESVSRADKAMLEIERLQLLPDTPESAEYWGTWQDFRDDPSAVPEHCWPQCWPPEVAKTIFLDRFREVQQ